MGVMACDRWSCNNVMCNICIDKKWYMCGECRDEFIRYVDSVNAEAINEHELLAITEEFMKTRKGKYNAGGEMTATQFINKYTIS